MTTELNIGRVLFLEHETLVQAVQETELSAQDLLNEDIVTEEDIEDLVPLELNAAETLEELENCAINASNEEITLDLQADEPFPTSREYHEEEFMAGCL